MDVTDLMMEDKKGRIGFVTTVDDCRVSSVEKQHLRCLPVSEPVCMEAAVQHSLTVTNVDLVF